jgi:SHS2 domain-containing protein
MRKYEFLEHVADIRLKIEADSLEELFSAAVEGMNEIACKKRDGILEADVIEEVGIGAKDTTTLLINFLSDVLTYMHVNRAIYTKIIFTELDEKSLQATINGFHIDKFDEDIKAVTYHEAEVVKNDKGNFEAVIVFDI